MRKECLLLPVLVSLLHAQITAYMISHAEPNSSGTGLSAAGTSRAQCLVNVFSYSAPIYASVGHIVAQPAYTNGSQTSIDTVTPLADSLGLTVDTSCANDSDAGACIAGIVAQLNGDLDGGFSGDVLIAWETDVFSDAIASLQYEYVGVMWDDPPTFPVDGYDTIWQDEYEYSSINTLSEGCTSTDS